jgi:hypothetical protein
MKKIVNGIEMDLPDSATTDTLLQRLGEPADSIVYGITQGSEHRVLHKGESLKAVDSERIGISSRFRTGKDREP